MIVPHLPLSGLCGYSLSVTVPAPWAGKTNTLLSVQPLADAAASPFYLLQVQQNITPANADAFARRVLAETQPQKVVILDTLSAGYYVAAGAADTAPAIHVLDSRKARDAGPALPARAAYMVAPNMLNSVGSAIIQQVCC